MTIVHNNYYVTASKERCGRRLVGIQGVVDGSTLYFPLKTHIKSYSLVVFVHVINFNSF